MEDNIQETTSKATRSVKWSALTEVVSRTASPIILVVLARLLTPDDFGVIATTMIAVSFSQMLWDAGLSKALVQTEEPIETAANVVFWTNILLGIFVYLILLGLAPTIARFFNSPASGPVLRVLGLQIVIGSLTSVQQALFVRDLDFQGLFWIKLLTAFFPGLFSIPMAFFGYGVWALVAGSIAGQLLNLLLLWNYSSWRPTFRYNLPCAKKMFRFGLWVLAEAFGGWLIMWGDGLIVGKYFGVHDLGVYRTGIMIVSIIFSVTLNSFLPILYPSFSRLQHDIPKLVQAFHKTIRIIMTLALPVGIGLFVVGQDAATVLFGNKWEGLGFVLSILGLKEGLTWAVGINPETYRAMGRPDINTKFMIIQILYFLPAYFVGAQFGLWVFVYVRMAVALAAIPIQIYFCTRMLGVSPWYLWQDGRSSVLAAIAMGMGVWVVKLLFQSLALCLSGRIELVTLIGTGVFLYATALWALDRAFVAQLADLVRRVLSFQAEKHVYR
jgi:O-antigen/teichoic acid export membrane protein